MSQDTTKKSGTKRKTTPTKRSVEPLKETTAEHAAGTLKIFSTKKAEKPQVDKKSQSDSKAIEPEKPATAQKDTAASKDASSQESSKDAKSKRTAPVQKIDRTQRSDRAQRAERGQRPERGQSSERTQKSERTNKPQFSVASLVELKDNALDFARNHTKLVVFLGVVIFLLVGLYPPIRGYYHAVREHDELLLNQQKLEEDQKRLESEVQGLQTKEGIIDEAHKQGLVSGGEESARVEGLDKKKDENTVQHPDYPWYIKVGDFVFGFTPGDSGNTEAPKSANSDDPTSAPAPGESNDQKNSGEGGSSEGSDSNNSKSDSGNSH
ncbi:MAG: hypothetical protein HXK23_00525 [Lancefieldella parvula]|uniref:Septum formation initiator n=1 Tax=Lancefieldella parvula TaxID=1382 RepID=A0A930W2Q2_9ACTN|nr:hypothetical protein [Lancefieldella parvula]